MINELPVPALLWLAAWTAVAFAQDDIGSPAAWAAVALAALTAAALTVIAARAARTRPAIGRALAAAFDPASTPPPMTATTPRGHARGHARDRRAAAPRRRARAAALIAPLPLRGRGVRHVAGIPYRDAGRRNLLDVRHHRSRPPGGPVLVYLHGGGFTGGHRNREARPLLNRLAGRGWLCVSADYRLRPGSRFPDPLVDAKKAIAWARAHAAEYGADPSQVFVAGSSAGAHLAAMAALTAGDPSCQPGFEDADTTVTAAICLYGYYGEVYDDGAATSPEHHLHPGAPPFLIAHGDRDTCVPVEAARRFARRLRETSRAPVVYAELPGAQHVFDLFRSTRFAAVVDGIETFTAQVRVAHQPRAFTK
ncbi:alpha/beta hydrolase [Actinomadura graeca]|uniref:alpha/beta hydrolase n=1 Tax=Actinomadura graeca TaxID=2750812 RepID=UPI001E5C2539|nr:alpha/beta hydrolase [Actinomadura graeca]